MGPLLDLLQLDLLQSITFWAAVGAIVVLLPVIVAVFRGPNPKKRGALSEKQRITAQAKDAAQRFNFWIKTYYHYGQKPDSERLVDWLETDRGHEVLEGDYRIFTKMAELLRKQGYKIKPLLSQAEFESAVSRAKEKESRRQRVTSSPVASD